MLVVRANETADQPLKLFVKPPIRALSWALLGAAFVTLALGTVVTGTGPHSGDAAANGRLPFDPRTVSWLHADLVLLFLGLTIGMIVTLAVTDSPISSRRHAWILLGLILMQGLIGYVQYFTGLPWVLVLCHLLGACLVWIAVVTMHLSLRKRGEP